MTGVIVVGDVDYTPSPRGRLASVAVPSGTTRRVPREYPTIQAAVDAACPATWCWWTAGSTRRR